MPPEASESGNVCSKKASIWLLGLAKQLSWLLNPRWDLWSDSKSEADSRCEASAPRLPVHGSPSEEAAYLTSRSNQTHHQKNI